MYDAKTHSSEINSQQANLTTTNLINCFKIKTWAIRFRQYSKMSHIQKQYIYSFLSIRKGGVGSFQEGTAYTRVDIFLITDCRNPVAILVTPAPVSRVKAANISLYIENIDARNVKVSLCRTRTTN